MKDEEEDNIDHRFKEGLSNAEDNIAFRNSDWDAMEKLLDEEKRRKGFIYFLPRIITGIAALLLLTLGFFFLRPETKPGTNNNNNVARIKPSGTNNNSLNNNTNNTKANPVNGNGSNPGINNNSSDSDNTTGANPADNKGSALANNNNKTIDKTSTYTTPSNGNSGTNEAKARLKDQQLPAPALTSNQVAVHPGNKPGKKPGNRLNAAHKGLLDDDAEITGGYTASASKAPKGVPNQIGLNNNPAEVLTASGTGILNDSLSLTTASLNATDKQLDNSNKRYAAAVKQKKKPTVNALWPSHAVVLSVLTAPDLNGVGSSFSRAQVGSTTGLTLSVGLSSRFTISTGAMYAKKPYAASFSQYNPAYQFKITPTDVYADCRVLDIPINIDYRLYSKGRNMVALGTGISSYFMLRENYRFDYNTSGAAGPGTYSISNKNQHILGILNLNATYQRRINEKFGLNVQPYMKLPLTNIGYGRVDLQSTGVAVGVSWYLSSGRPK